MSKFVTFEGIDGSGKSTVSKKIFEKLKNEGHKVVYTFEPTDSWIGRIVQRCIESENDPYITAFTFIVDRIDHCKQIKKWLDQGMIVLCDRYAESTYAYQGAQMKNMINNPMGWLKDLSKGRIIIPDITFLFIIDPKVSLRRIKNRDNLIPFEKVDFLDEVNKNYLKLANNNRFIQVDATMSIDELVDFCYKAIIN